MDNPIVVILLIVGVSALVFFLIKKFHNPRRDQEGPEVYYTPVFLPKHLKGSTPKGIPVHSYQASVSQATKDAIDRGMQKGFDAAKARGWQQGLNVSEYIVGVFSKADKCASGPAFLIKGWTVGIVGGEENKSYDGTPYDLNPAPGQFEICAAGKFGLFTDAARGIPRKLAISVVDDAAMTEIAAYNEAEHALAYMNDLDLFARTMGPDHGHPILV